MLNNLRKAVPSKAYAKAGSLLVQLLHPDVSKRTTAKQALATDFFTRGLWQGQGSPFELVYNMAGGIIHSVVSSIVCSIFVWHRYTIVNSKLVYEDAAALSVQPAATWWMLMTFEDLWGALDVMHRKKDPPVQPLRSHSELPGTGSHHSCRLQKIWQASAVCQRSALLQNCHYSTCTAAGSRRSGKHQRVVRGARWYSTVAAALSTDDTGVTAQSSGLQQAGQAPASCQRLLRGLWKC